MAKRAKVNLEFLLVKAEVKGVPEKALLGRISGACECQGGGTVALRSPKLQSAK